MTLPTFLIIGAPKSGTTSLWAYLNQHPQVFLSPNKEPNYFALTGARLPDGGPAPPEILQKLIHFHSVTDFERYQALFSGAGVHPAVGEASVRYLYYPQAAERIREGLPDVRMIAILREPVSRLYSHYCMNVQFQLEPLELLDAIDAEPQRRNDGWGWDWHYMAIGTYAPQLKRYFSLFSRDQLKVFLYDDLIKQPMQVFRETCRHIGVDADFVPDMSSRSKVAYRPRNLRLDKLLHWPNPLRESLERIHAGLVRRAVDRVRDWNAMPVPKLSASVRDALRPRFRADIEELESLLGRRTGWLV